MSTPEPDDDGPSACNDSHRAFLQAFISRQTLTFDEAKPVLARILSLHDGRRVLENDVTFQDFANIIQVVNTQLDQFGFEIRFTFPQVAQHRSEQHRIYAMVNTHSDQLTQLATTQSPDEIAYTKRVLDAMFEKYNTPAREVMAITSLDALRLSKAPRDRESAVSVNGEATQGSTGSSITQKQAEQLLGRLVQEGWFDRSRAGFYTLSPRGLLELRQWLYDAYNDADCDETEWQPIKDCNACKEIVTIGQRCASEDCNCRLHDFCARGMFRNQQTRKCPVCKTEWLESKFVGERASRNFQPSRTSGGSRAGGARRGETVDSDEDEDG